MLEDLSLIFFSHSLAHKKYGNNIVRKLSEFSYLDFREIVELFGRKLDFESPPEVMMQKNSSF